MGCETLDVNFYKSIMDQSPLGYAYHKIICDEKGIPCDYEFIEVNNAFGKLIGLKPSDIIGKKATDVFPKLNEEDFGYIKIYGYIALNGGNKEIEGYSQLLNCWYRIKIYSNKKGYFITYVSDISKEMIQLLALKKVVILSEELLQLSSGEIDFQRITDNLLDISKAKYVALNMYNDKCDKFTTKALAGIKDSIIIANTILGFKIKGSEWDHDPVRDKKISNNILTRFPSLSEFSGKIISQKIIKFIEKLFCIGEVVLVRIIKGDKTLGDFTLFMPKGKILENENIVEIYTREVGMIITRKKIEEEIVYLSYHDQLTGLYNRRFFEEELNRVNEENKLPLSIIMVDVNGLKLMNDVFGHEKGDELLKRSAEIIQIGCRKSDIVTRYGGDEFVIILKETTKEESKEIIKSIKALISKEYINGVRISLSLGYYTKSVASQDIKKILKNAEDDMYKNKALESKINRGNEINVLLNIIGEKDPSEDKHSKIVSKLCNDIGNAINLSELDVNKIRTAGLLHDIGKVALAKDILNKKDELTEANIEEIMRHSEIGYRILNIVGGMSEVAEYILYHHERWDGKGYPKGLKGKAIPLQSRIISVADAYDTMTSGRSGKSKLSKEEAIKELEKNCGVKFDPELVEVFIKRVLEEYPIE